MVLTEKLRRPSALAIAVLMLLASLVPLLSRQQVGAYGLITDREIKLSSSANGSTTAGQDVTYAVSFVTSTASDIEALVVEFCSDSPIIGDTCTLPTNFDINEVGLALANQVGVGANEFSVHADTDNNTLVLNRTSASIAASTTVSLDLGAGGGSDGVTNPHTTNTTFYARILTYELLTEAQAYVTGTLGDPVDAGGIALSTAAQITVTSKVQERLTFCVYTDGNGDSTLGDPNLTNCTGVAGTAVSLGDDNGVLSDAGEFVDKTAMYNVSTNASNNVTIRAKGTTLTSGSFTIDPAGAQAAGDPGDGSGEATSTGAEQFGFCTYLDGGSATGLAPVAPYNDAGCSATTQTAGTATPGGAGGALFAFDETSVDNLSTTFGDVIATKAPGAQSTGYLVFVGNIATTTEPGIYTSTLTFIATGNY